MTFFLNSLLRGEELVIIYIYMLHIPKFFSLRMLATDFAMNIQIGGQAD